MERWRLTFKIGIPHKIAALALGILASGPVHAQMPLLGPNSPGFGRLRGFQFYGLTSSATYFDNRLSNTQIPQPFTGSDWLFQSSASMGWSRPSKNTNTSIGYAPSYFGSLRNPDWSFWNHSLTLNTNTPRTLTISPRWTFDFALMTNFTNLNQSLFAPTTLDNIASAPASFDQLAGAMIRQNPSSDQLAPVINGVPVTDSAANVLFYGDRMFMGGVQGTFTYAQSGRLSMMFGGGGSRMQHLTSFGGGSNPSRHLVPYTNNANANVGLSYSLSPRTQIGVNTGTVRTFNRLQDSYANYATAFAGWTLSRRWFLTVTGGAGMIVPLRETYRVPTKVGYMGGTVIGYKTREHAFLVDVKRSIGDNYGIGSNATMSADAAWSWSRPGRSWWISAGSGRQDLGTPGSSNIQAWRSHASFGQAIGWGFVLNMQYAYLTYNADFLSQAYKLRANAATVGISWTPHAGLVR